ncbi:BlaI/MecI/CopY family transcriptional regulator [Pseudonocardia spinosispora]|uniref:BlaI/MecI/CopY family transcriptional regulator n=1 Tax=Pseudonocardia spinosispora TaxID=103441 RepID=UPI0004910D08|nr:BlaI/MecI/CopY family transcriptional regulator [Pseudonocardia spinosispora]
MPGEDGSRPHGLAAHFGTLELPILEVLWAGGARDVADCVTRLSGDHAYTTVKTVMERLVKKGLLDRCKESRSYVYWPSQTRSEVEARLAAQQARQLVDGFGDLAVTHFVETVQTDSDRLTQLRRLLAGIAAEGPEEDPR